MPRVLAGLAGVALLLGLTAVPAVAAATGAERTVGVQTVRFQVVMHGDPAAQQFRTTGAHGQLRYGNGMLTGTATIAGAPWAVELLAEVRYTDGAGPFRGFWTFTDATGDTLAFDYAGRTTVRQGATDIRGTLDTIGGSGALAAVTGRGTVRGIRRTDLGGDVEYTFTLRLRGLPR